MHYLVEPGLYALGTPNEKSPVMVTANYKMSFDHLRQALTGHNVWILVLDTKGINVWCSAGKGTFGTEELTRRIQSSGLAMVVTHREIILPQLSAPGVAAHEVKKISGFKVIYGPIRAKDLPIFLDAGFKATSEMRVKTFPLRERIVLIPIELWPALKGGFIFSFILFLIAFMWRWGEGWTLALNHALTPVMAILIAIFSGAVLTPILLPWLPGRAFSSKGAWVGIFSSVLFHFFRLALRVKITGHLESIAWFLLIPAVSAFLAMNFTGASTFTSLSGVKKEMRWALPFQIGAGTIGVILWLGSQFFL